MRKRIVDTRLQVVPRLHFVHVKHELLVLGDIPLFERSEQVEPAVRVVVPVVALLRVRHSERPSANGTVRPRGGCVRAHAQFTTKWRVVQDSEREAGVPGIQEDSASS